MTRRPAILPRLAALRTRFARDESGASLVEFSIVVLLFLFLLFAIIDFGRMANTWVAASKATQAAARLAAVRPPACGGVPETNERGTAIPAGDYGSFCRSGSNVCADPGPAICTGDAANATASEIFARIRPLLPTNAQIGNLQFRYDHDPDLGFLGGPYIPAVTVELTGVQFEFVTGLGAFARALTGGEGEIGNAITIPNMSATLPGEDLALGMGG